MSISSRTTTATVSLLALVAAGAADAQSFRDNRGGGNQGPRGGAPSRQIVVERPLFSPQVSSNNRISPQVQPSPRFSPQIPIQNASPQIPAGPRISPQVPFQNASPQIQPSPRFSPQVPFQSASPQIQPQPRFSPQVATNTGFSPQTPSFSPQVQAGPVQQASARPFSSPQVAPIQQGGPIQQQVASGPRFNPAIPLAAAAVTGSIVAASAATSPSGFAQPAQPVAFTGQPQLVEQPQQQFQPQQQLVEQAQGVIAAAQTETAEPRARIIGTYRDAEGQLQYLREGDTQNLANAEEIWSAPRPYYAHYAPARVVYETASYGYRAYGRTAYGAHCAR